MEIVLDDKFCQIFERYTSNKGIPASGDIIIVISEQGVVLIQPEEKSACLRQKNTNSKESK